jgi:hypothetical protein
MRWSGKYLGIIHKRWNCKYLVSSSTSWNEMCRDISVQYRPKIADSDMPWKERRYCKITCHKPKNKVTHLTFLIDEFMISLTFLHGHSDILSLYSIRLIFRNKHKINSMKSGTETAHHHTYKFYTRYGLDVNNYKHGDGAKLWGYILQMKCMRAVWKVRGLAAVRHSYAERCITTYQRRTAASPLTFQTVLIDAPLSLKGFF